MATFAKGAYDVVAYNAFRPVYPPRLFDTIWAYHQSSPHARWKRAVDLGCGTGQATLVLAEKFDEVIGTDPSSKMVKRATDQLKGIRIANPRNPSEEIEAASIVKYLQSPAENLSCLEDNSVDLLTAAQSCHWFDYSRLWSEAARVLRPNGTLAFWGYSEFRIRHYPQLIPLITYYGQGTQGLKSIGSGKIEPPQSEPEPDSIAAYWEQPGRSILDSNLILVPKPSDTLFHKSSSKHIMFSGDYFRQLDNTPVIREEVIMRKEMTWDLLEKYLRTASSLNTYLEQHPEETELAKQKSLGQGDGDIAQRFLKRLQQAILENSEATIPERIEVEWPLSLLLYRRVSQD